MLCCPDSVGKLLLNMLCTQTGALINAAVLSMSSPPLQVPQPRSVLVLRPEINSPPTCTTNQPVPSPSASPDAPASPPVCPMPLTFGCCIRQLTNVPLPPQRPDPRASTPVSQPQPLRHSPCLCHCR